MLLVLSSINSCSTTTNEKIVSPIYLPDIKDEQFLCSISGSNCAPILFKDYDLDLVCMPAEAFLQTFSAH